MKTLMSLKKLFSKTVIEYDLNMLSRHSFSSFIFPLHFRLLLFLLKHGKFYYSPL